MINQTGANFQGKIHPAKTCQKYYISCQNHTKSGPLPVKTRHFLTEIFKNIQKCSEISAYQDEERRHKGTKAQRHKGTKLYCVAARPSFNIFSHRGRREFKPRMDANIREELEARIWVVMVGNGWVLHKYLPF